MQKQWDSIVVPGRVSKSSLKKKWCLLLLWNAVTSPNCPLTIHITMQQQRLVFSWRILMNRFTGNTNFVTWFSRLAILWPINVVIVSLSPHTPMVVCCKIIISLTTCTPLRLLWNRVHDELWYLANRVEQASKSKPFLMLQRGGLERDDDAIGDSIKVVYPRVASWHPALTICHWQQV